MQEPVADASNRFGVGRRWGAAIAGIPAMAARPTHFLCAVKAGSVSYDYNTPAVNRWDV